MPARLTRGALVAGIVAFAAALGGTYAATAGGGTPEAGPPLGARAVPLELPRPSGGGLSLGPAETIPPLADPAPRRAGAPAPGPAAPEPSPVRPEPASVSPAPAPAADPAAAPPHDPVAAPPPEPRPGPAPPLDAVPAPPPQPRPRPAPPAPAPVPAPPPPEPPAVEFDDSG